MNNLNNKLGTTHADAEFAADISPYGDVPIVQSRCKEEISTLKDRGGKTALAFAGGGIRGFSHIGIIDFMEQEGLSADMVGGTSMGSVMASLYAAGVKSSDMLAFCMDVERAFMGKKPLAKPYSELFVAPKSDFGSKLRDIDGFRNSKFAEDVMEGAFQKLGVKYFSDLKMPLVIPAVDINTSKLVLFCNDDSMFERSPHYDCITDAPISLAVRASCAYPLMLSSVIYKGYRLVDGGTRLNIPIWPLRSMGAERILASWMSSYRKDGTPKSFYDIGIRAMDLMSSQLTEVHAEQADGVISVKADDVSPFDMGAGSTLYLRGLTAAAENRELIYNLFAKE